MDVYLPRGRMKITNNFNKCCKPRRLNNFAGNERSNSHSDSCGKKVRYKHFEQISDDVLTMRSVIKAHQEVEKSGKMQLFKALPEITIGMIGTSIAIAQPGKLASKAGAGLGFLMLAKAVDIISSSIAPKVNNFVEAKKNDNEKRNVTQLKKAALLTATSVAGALGAFGLVKGISNAKAFEGVVNFAKKEMAQLSDELNKTKLGKFVENSVKPFANKHPNLVKNAEVIAPLGIMGLSTLAQVKLADSLSKDIKTKADENYIKGKLIQQEAKAHFDSIEAEEI